MPRKYSVEFKEKAVHQIIEMVRLESCSLQRAYTEVGELLGVSHHTLRAWYRDSASVRDDSDASGGETMEEELKRLRRENRELKRANGILKTASAFFRSGTRPTHDQMISYIDAYKDQFGARAHLQSSKTSRSWIHYLSWLPQGDHSCSQRKGLKR